LGCGDGEVLLEAAKLGATGIGVEIDPVRVFVARLRIFKNRLNNKVAIKRKDLFKEDLTNASVIIVYLVPKTLDKLLPKFKKQLKKGTRIVSFRYDLKLSPKKVDTESNLRLYVI
jgi:ribosomal protein L11 methylase PrmA